MLFFLHGFSDHSNLHYSLFPTLASKNIEVIAFDQRGYGRSVKDKASCGATGSTATVLADITSVIESYLPQITVPIFLMGHSMGGAETLYYAARGPAHVRKRIRGYISESPWIALHESAQPNKFTVAAGRLVSKILPRRQRPVDLDAKTISRDPAVCEEFARDELCHNIGTLEGLTGCFERAEQLSSGLAMPVDKALGKQSPASVLLAHGTADAVTSFSASKNFMDKLQVKDKEFRSYDGWYHKCMSHRIQSESATCLYSSSTCRARWGRSSVFQRGCRLDSR